MKTSSLIAKLNELNLTIGSIESFTGGLFGATLVDYPGASKTYKGSVIAYHDDIKHRLIKIKESDLENYGAVSSKVALAMARKGKKLLDVDFCFSFTGNAGPTSSDDKEVGEVFIALVYSGGEILEHLHIEGNRTKVRTESVSHALNMLERVLENYI